MVTFPGCLLLRFLTAAILIPIVLAAVVAGHIFFVLLIGCCAVAMVIEWVALCHDHRALTGEHRLSRDLRDPAALLLLLVVLAGIGGLAFSQIMMTIILASIAIPVIALAGHSRKEGDRRKKNWLLAAGVAYILIPCAALLWLRLFAESGFDIILWLLVVVWATDTGAYMVGRSLGGPRLLPVISPNKTWSGLMGGIIAAAVSAVLLDHFLDLSPSSFVLALGGAGLAVIAQGGDFLESAMKRHCGVKDSGRLIPGHGGILDRVDGLVTAAPAAALAVMLWP